MDFSCTGGAGGRRCWLLPSRYLSWPVAGQRIEQFHDAAEHFNDRNFVSIEPSTELGFEFF